MGIPYACGAGLVQAARALYLPPMRLETGPFIDLVQSKYNLHWCHLHPEKKYFKTDSWATGKVQTPMFTMGCQKEFKWKEI